MLRQKPITQPITDMKRARLLTPILLLLISVLLITSANGEIFAKPAAEGGRLLITRSPTMGRNVTIMLTIDGKPAGSLTWGRTYDRFITPGSHVLIASPSRTGRAWQATLDVRAGQTYSYSAAYNVDKLVLTPKTR